MFNESIQLVFVESEERTLLPDYLRYLSNGLYATPRSGEWRRHDERFHFRRIIFLSSTETAFIMNSALIGLNLLLAGEENKSRKIAEDIDYFLTDAPSVQNETRRTLEAIQREYGVQERLF